jgi:uncharacterized protein
MTVTIKSSRRTFLGSTIALCSGVVRPGAAEAQDLPKAERTLDLHVHLFGTGDGGSGCRISKRIRDGHLFKGLERMLRLRERAATVDEGYVLALAEQLETSSIEKAVVLSQDAVYDPNGQPDWDSTPFYVSNDYLLKVVARFPQSMIPCVSINPQRRDAIPELERCAAQGAAVLKIHPPIQGVDLSEKKYIPFFRRCADLKMVVMVHTGHEHSSPIISVTLANPRKLTLALEEGCTVVACHCGTGWPTDTIDMLPDFLAMIRRYDNLWGDTAVLGSAGRVRDLSRLLADDLARDRLLHGSDFPFPPVPLAFTGKLGLRKAARLQAIGSLVEQDFALKISLGIGQASAERGWRLICDNESQ